MISHASKKQKRLGRNVGICASIGVAVWILLLLLTASTASKNTSGASYDVTFGPLTLQRISKHKVEGGATTASFSFESGLLWYFLSWIVAGFTISVAQQRFRIRPGPGPSDEA